MPGQPDKMLGSMGIYVFNTDVMYELLFQDAAKKEASSHDFGRDIIPAMIAGGSRVFAYPFRDENRKDAAYWRDVGTLDAYFQTSMDLIQIDPILNLYDQDWPIHTHQPAYPPPKFVHTEGDRRGAAFNSIVCQGAIISGGQVYRSIVSPGVRVNSFALVEDAILFDGVVVGRNARIRRAIIDKDVRIPTGFEIGWNRDADLARGFTVTDDGIIVVAKGEDLERFVHIESTTGSRTGPHQYRRRVWLADLRPMAGPTDEWRDIDSVQVLLDPFGFAVEVMNVCLSDRR